MALEFTKATKHKARARISLAGPPGSGKTYTALTFAAVLGERVAVIDTERGSASKYADLFAFDTLELESFEPERYIDAIEAAIRARYDVLVIDSLSHAWAGKGGILEIVDRATNESRSKDSYHVGWKKATPIQNRLIDAILQAPLHVIVTMRTKMEYAVERDANGKMAPRKVGLAPVQKDGVEYEFDVVGDLDQDQRLRITKTRCSALTNSVVEHPGRAVAEVIKAWLTDGVGVVDAKGIRTTKDEPPPQGHQPRQSGERLRPPPSGTGIQPAPPRQSGGLEPRDDRAQAHPSYPDPAVRAVEADEREKFQRQERIVHLMRELEPQGFRITRQVNTGRVTLSFPKAIETLGRVVKLDQLNVEDLDWLEKKLTDQIAARAAGGSHPAPAAPSPGPRDRSTRNDPGRPTATEGSRGSRGEPREPGDDDDDAPPPY